MKFMQTHLDEAQILYFEQQLQKIHSQVFEKKYPAVKARDIFPFENESRPGVKELVYRIYGDVGYAKIISNYADDLPRVDLLAEEMRAKVRPIGDAYGYSVDDIQTAQLTGLDLDGRKAAIARRKQLVTENRLAWFGDANYNIQGFLNHPNIPLSTVPADGQGGLTTFASKSADQILRDILDLFNSIQDQTNEVHVANTLLLPTDKSVKTALQKRIPDTSKTVLQYIKENHPEIQRIEYVKELNNPFGNGNMMVAGEFDPENLTLEVPQEFQPMPAQLRNLEYLINCWAKTAGVIVRFPLAFAFADGI